MSSLADGQSRFVACLQKGPAHFPADLFSQNAERALLGLKAHANNISHARLVALEDSFPRLHAHMGHEIFHAISRDYVEQDHIMACDINHIAADFSTFLADRANSGTEIDIARIEWAWIESYRSVEAPPVVLTDIATLAEDKLLAFPIAAHPAMHLIAITGPLSPELGELANAEPHALMIARPQAQILFHPLTAVEHAIAEKIADSMTMGNLLQYALELSDEATAMQHIIKLIQTGALTQITG
ncbi:putative DNA-binding domain-containing protein [Parasphingorhabdus sp.]|uniref:HvfC/BufC family peptide modification chaperone n=1 Tax=Parasphingorhabdus sp. TaxID=2709688 RepID=UPI003C79113D